MQPYDIFMLIVLVGAAAFGAWKGMAWQVASIASVLLSALVAMRFSGLLAPSLSAEEPWNQFLAMGILFASTSLAVWIVFRLIAKVIDRVKLKEFDRQMGALLGTAKGVLYCLILTFFAVTLSEGTRQRVLASRSGYYAAVLVHKGTPLMPEKIRVALGKYIQRLGEGLDPASPPIAPAEVPASTADPLGGAVVDTQTPASPWGVQPAPPLSLDSLKQGAQNLASQQVEQIGNQMSSAIQQEIGQYGRQAQAAVNQHLDAAGQSYNQLRTSAQQTGTHLQDQVNGGLNQYGTQATDAVGQGYNQFRTSAEQTATQLQNQVNRGVNQLGGQTTDAVEQGYNQFRTSAEQAGAKLQSEINRGFDALGRRIQQAPMKPIQ